MNPLDTIQLSVLSHFIVQSKIEPQIFFNEAEKYIKYRILY